MNNNLENFKEKLNAIKECIIDYSTPIFIVGDMRSLKELAVCEMSATLNKEELIIIGNRYPDWVLKIKNNSENYNNLLVITDFEKISTEEQKLFVDIICRNCVSSENLPDNLKIIINANDRCELIEDIADIIQYFEI